MGRLVIFVYTELRARHVIMKALGARIKKKNQKVRKGNASLGKVVSKIPK